MTAKTRLPAFPNPRRDNLHYLGSIENSRLNLFMLMEGLVSVFRQHRSDNQKI